MNASNMKTAGRARREAGFTIVELMVGVLVGLIASVVMFQVFAVSESQKRTTTGAGDAQQSGLVSLFQLERDVRMAGNGLNLPAFLGCQTNGYDQVGGAGFSLPLVPVSITNGAGGAPDQVTIISGSSDLMVAAERLRNPMTVGSDPISVNNRYGFALGDVVVIAESGKPCAMAQVSSFIGLTDLGHTAGSFVDGAGQPQTTRFNGPIAGFPGYVAWVRATNGGGRIFNLGNSPTLTTYAVQNNTLVAMDATAPTPANTVTIADNIVQLQAQYGYDGNGDGQITAPTNVAVLNPVGADQWADAVPVGMTAQQWQRVVAVRLAVVARSVTPEKPPTIGGACNTTTVGPRWFARDPATAFNIDVSAASADWMCFRYRVFEVTIPIRNVAWFPSE